MDPVFKKLLVQLRIGTCRDTATECCRVCKCHKRGQDRVSSIEGNNLRLLVGMAFELEDNTAIELTEMMVKYVGTVTRRVQKKSRNKDIAGDPHIKGFFLGTLR